MREQSKAVGKRSARGAHIRVRRGGGRPVSVRPRKLHVVTPSSAAEIRKTLGILNADIKAALEAIGR